MYNFNKEYCKNCNNTFTLERITYPSNVDEKRKSYVICPYCGSLVRYIYLKGDEDIIETRN